MKEQYYEQVKLSHILQQNTNNVIIQELNFLLKFINSSVILKMTNQVICICSRSNE